VSGGENQPKDRLRRRLKRLAFPPEPPYPEERRKPSSPPDASWTERYEAAVEAENRFLDEDPDGNWHMFRAIFPLAVVGVVLVAWLISVLSG
jgi:hypothetical protein